MRAIITFHSIDESGSLLSFDPKVLDALLTALERRSVPVRDLDDLLGPGARSGVALTFDDGMRSVFTHALPVLRVHGVPTHLFLTTRSVGADNRWPGQPHDAPQFRMLDWTQIEALHAGGMRIESHTARHPDLRALDDGAIEDECCEADEIIERRVGRRPRYFAYPYGHHDARVRATVGRRYDASFTTELRFLGECDDPAALPRLDSYYLRRRWIYSGLGTPGTRAYLSLRHGLRWLKSAL